jgi:hypothetical protein
MTVMLEYRDILEMCTNVISLDKEFCLSTPRRALVNSESRSLNPIIVILRDIFDI